jgi:hypothetical protein
MTDGKAVLIFKYMRHLSVKLSTNVVDMQEALHDPCGSLTRCPTFSNAFESFMDTYIKNQHGQLFPTPNIGEQA